MATELGGRTLTPGVYRNGTLGLTGTLTLDAQGDPNAVFVFQTDSTLITASSSRVRVINGAQACNVFWQVGSSATLGTTTGFVGTVLALTSITANNGATVQGRLLARNGAVTLDNNTITASGCAASAPTTTTTTTPATTTTSAPATTTTTASPTTTTTAVAAPATDAPTDATGGGGGDLSTVTGSPGPVPTGSTGAPTPPTGGGSATGTPMLPATGSGLTTAALLGAAAVLLGAAMVRRSATL